MSDYLALSTTDSEKVTQPNRMERDFINPIKILELTIPPEDAEHNKVPGIFFSKPCNLFKKAFVGIRLSRLLQSRSFYVMYCC
jgi:hypothetical protein